MNLSRARHCAPELIVLDEAGSTNDELADRAAVEALPPYTALVTAHQTAGRGRRDRGWSTPAGRGLAISVLLPSPPPGEAAWLPLAAGLAMRDSVAALLPHSDVNVKWPNDVLVGERKVCGVLGRLTAQGVVMGAGVNVRLRADELPVPTATSLVLAGAADGPDLDDRLLAGYLARITELVGGLLERGAEASGLRLAVTAACGTLGREVRVELPGGSEFRGRAVAIAPDARLVVRTASGDESVAAGDVVHVRPASS
ncbi:biotin--[acetyl-CoA-carboxylase] ligase [Pseudolysinimonas kribbensis]|uniref:biotin--[biotin carboxyl-carrier protein] ligase n=1 Tax=Pseudolysinimonas kribbensis TaxID=433641 RepID=A0ABQ6K4B2_9MICO|nr:biotin--[acetyl-CoA-carboxylase] ligase [Pseudolysinimonas kribbensis]GMA94284.1 biotin--[acetyl-CoA-carboxylase] ligase [Pseudolysinimonas kribbensis]